jgi:hypothetical protein
LIAVADYVAIAAVTAAMAAAAVSSTASYMLKLMLNSIKA